MLKNRSDFLKARSGVRAHGKGFVIEAVWQEPRTDAPGPCRFGVTVTNKAVRHLIKAPPGQQKGKNAAVNNGQVMKQARQQGQKRGPVSVKRNLLRRRLKEALRCVAPKLDHRGVDYVVIGRPALSTIKFENLMKDLEKSFHYVYRKLISTGNNVG